VIWDVTVVSPSAASSIDRAVTDGGTLADIAASSKTVKYSTLSSMNSLFFSQLQLKVLVHLVQQRWTFFWNWAAGLALSLAMSEFILTATYFCCNTAL